MFHACISLFFFPPIPSPLSFPPPAQLSVCLSLLLLFTPPSFPPSLSLPPSSRGANSQEKNMFSPQKSSVDILPLLPSCCCWCCWSYSCPPSMTHSFFLRLPPSLPLSLLQPLCPNHSYFASLCVNLFSLFAVFPLRTVCLSVSLFCLSLFACSPSLPPSLPPALE